MITGFLLVAITALFLAHHASVAHDRKRPARARVVRVCAYCNIILGAFPSSLEKNIILMEDVRAPKSSGIVITHGMCNDCFKKEMEQLEREP